MSRHPARLDRLVVLAALAAAAWGVYRHFATMPSPGVETMRDDAYYEFVWAANLATGRGPTVSDGVTTSGVQYLWSLLLAGGAWLIGPMATPLVACYLGWLCHLGAAVLWIVGCRERVVGWGIGLLWLGHPLLLREAGNGQETALAGLLATAVLLSRRAPTWRFALLAMAAVLARTDLLALVLAMCWVRRGERPAGCVPVALAALAAPLVLNLVLGGGLLQDSAAPMAWLWHDHQEVTDGGFAGWLRRQWWYLRPALLGGPFATASVFGWGFVVFAAVRPWWPKALRALPAVAVGAAAALGVHDLATPGWAALLLVLFPSARVRRLPRLPLAVLFGLGAIVVVHWAVRWYPRDYYLCPLVAGAFAVVARYGRLRLALLTLAVVQVQDSWRIRPEPLRGQNCMAMAGLGLEKVLPAGERVGCFNSGIVTWFAAITADEDCRNPIVNLDGVVDRRSFAALQRHELDAWLDREGIRFVLDNPLQFARESKSPHACGRYFGAQFDPARDLVEVARFYVPFAGPGGTIADGSAQDSMVLYWRRGRGEPPVRPTGPGILDDCSPSPVAHSPQPAGAEMHFERGDGARTTLHLDGPTTLFLWMPPGVGFAGR